MGSLVRFYWPVALPRVPETNYSQLPKDKRIQFFEYELKSPRPSGQIMIGYSDSNKDGGIMSSLVELRHAQNQLSAIGQQHGVHVRFFHGRGGTISRGAGPTDRFVRALSDGTLCGDLRLTEQGETIAQKYAHQTSTIYNLEQFLAGVTRKTLSDLHEPSSSHALEETLEAVEKHGLPLLVHAEMTDPDIDVFDREAVFLDRQLAPVTRRFSGLRVVVEHVSTRIGGR